MKRERSASSVTRSAPKNKILIVSYGTMARICQTVIDELESEGISVGLFRPISCLPFPEDALYDEATKPISKRS